MGYFYTPRSTYIHALLQREFTVTFSPWLRTLTEYDKSLFDDTDIIKWVDQNSCGNLHHLWQTLTSSPLKPASKARYYSDFAGPGKKHFPYNCHISCAATQVKETTTIISLVLTDSGARDRKLSITLRFRIFQTWSVRGWSDSELSCSARGYKSTDNLRFCIAASMLYNLNRMVAREPPPHTRRYDIKMMTAASGQPA